MNNKLVVAIVAIVIVLGGGSYLLLKHPAASTNNGSTSSSSNYKQAMACDLFNQSEATQILGQGTTKSSVVNTDESTSDVAVTTCTYNNSATSVTATALVRSGLTANGTSTNKSGYDQTKTTDSVTAVTGLGDEAYYDTTLGQLSVMKGNNWILISSGGLMPSDHSQAQATSIAQAMLAKL